MEIDYSKKYGRLKVIRLNPDTQKYICICDCGKSCEVSKYNLLYGGTRSCGCLFLEGNNRKHGGNGTRLYGIWKGIRQRCNDINCNTYSRYGAKGIRVCKEWDDYSVFREWALTNGYSDDLTIDRIDSKGNYEPSNCRWVTYKVQNNNKSNVHKIKAFGEEHTLAEWSDLYNISRKTLYQRIFKQKWEVEKAISTPILQTR